MNKPSRPGRSILLLAAAASLIAVRIPAQERPDLELNLLPAPVSTASFSPAPLSTATLSAVPLIAAPLTKDQIVDNLIHRNQERSQSLLRSEATRIYHISYRGFPGEREAEMTVEATYQSPSTKDFKIIDQSGSKVLVTRVFKKLLEGEKEAAEPAIAARTQLNRDNYDFDLQGYEPSAAGGQYVLDVRPKSGSKYVYRGRVWVDAADFAVTRIEAEPAQNPSFWTRKSEIHHEYRKIQGFWLPVRNESISDIRLGGRATLVIEYKDYRLTDARQLTRDFNSTSVAGTAH
jgi:hypothetical protein